MRRGGERRYAEVAADAGPSRVCVEALGDARSRTCAEVVAEARASLARAALAPVETSRPHTAMQQTVARTLRLPPLRHEPDTRLATPEVCNFRTQEFPKPPSTAPTPLTMNVLDHPPKAPSKLKPLTNLPSEYNNSSEADTDPWPAILGCKKLPKLSCHRVSPNASLPDIHNINGYSKPFLLESIKETGAERKKSVKEKSAKDIIEGDLKKAHSKSETATKTTNMSKEARCKTHASQENNMAENSKVDFSLKSSLEGFQEIGSKEKDFLLPKIDVETLSVPSKTAPDILDCKKYNIGKFKNYQDENRKDSKRHHNSKLEGVHEMNLPVEDLKKQFGIGIIDPENTDTEKIPVESELSDNSKLVRARSSDNVFQIATEVHKRHVVHNSLLNNEATALSTNRNIAAKFKIEEGNTVTTVYAMKIREENNSDKSNTDLAFLEGDSKKNTKTNGSIILIPSEPVRTATKFYSTSRDNGYQAEHESDTESSDGDDKSCKEQKARIQAYMSNDEKPYRKKCFRSRSCSTLPLVKPCKKDSFSSLMQHLENENRKAQIKANLARQNIKNDPTKIKKLGRTRSVVRYLDPSLPLDGTAALKRSCTKVRKKNDLTSILLDKENSNVALLLEKHKQLVSEFSLTCYPLKLSVTSNRKTNNLDKPNSEMDVKKNGCLNKNLLLAEELAMRVKLSRTTAELTEATDKLYELIRREFSTMRSKRLNETVTSALGELAESEQGETALRVLRVLLVLKLRGAALSAVCRITFHLVKEPNNIDMFEKLGMVEAFMNALGSTNPLENAEACAWGYGAAEELGKVLAAKLANAGLVDILKLHLYLLNDARADAAPLPLAAAPATQRLAAAARVITSDPTALHRCCRTGLLVEMIRLAEMWPQCSTEVFHASRVLSAAADSQEACTVLSTEVGRVAYCLVRHVERADIAVRLAYCLGNILRKVEEAPSRLLHSESGLTWLANSLDHYLAWDMSLMNNAVAQREQTNGKRECDVEDTLLKIIRIIANMALDPEVSKAMVGADGSAVGVRLMNGILEVIRRNRSAPAVSAALAATANLAFGVGAPLDGPLSQQRLPLAENILPLLTSANHAAEAARALANLTTAAEVREYVGQSCAVEQLVEMVLTAVESFQVPTTDDETDDINGLFGGEARLEVGDPSGSENPIGSDAASTHAAPGNSATGNTALENTSGQPDERPQAVEAGEAAVGALVNLLGEWTVRPLFYRIGGPFALVAFLAHQPTLHLASLTCQAIHNYATDSPNLREDLGQISAEELDDVLEGLLAQANSGGDCSFVALANGIIKRLRQGN